MLFFGKGETKGGLQIISEATLKTTALFAPQKTGVGIYQEHSALPFPLEVTSRPRPVATATAGITRMLFKLYYEASPSNADLYIFLRGTVTRVAAATWISTPRSVTAPGRRTEDEKKNSALSGKKEKNRTEAPSAPAPERILSYNH